MPAGGQANVGTDYGRPLLAHHQALLEASAVSSAVGAARGYASVETKKRLESLGFPPSQRLVPALLVPVYNVHGELATYQIRPDEPRIVDGKALKYETPARSRMCLDVPRPARPWLDDPGRPLFVTEGARKADAGVSAGLCTVALLGVWNWRGSAESGGKVALPDWEAIALKGARDVGREVYVVFDSDVMQKQAVYLALCRLKAFLESRGAVVRVIYLPPGEGGTKVGLDDFLAAGHGPGDLLALASDAVRPPPDGGDPAGGDEGGTQADALVRLGSVGELLHDPIGDAYARVRVGDHVECWPIRSKGFRSWLQAAFYAERAKAANAEAISTALGVLEARAFFEGPEREVFLRVAPDGDGGIFVDLGDATWRAIHVSPTGYELVSDPPVCFRRSKGMRPLPEPVGAGSLDDLRRFVNVVDDDSWALVKAWLRGALRDRGPYPVLMLKGEQGSAKTTIARLLRSIVDPSVPELRAEPREARDLAIAARNCWVMAFDNVSHVQQWLSDAICRLATGGGFAIRELYSDFDEALFDATRPVLLTGISDYATKDDLLDRALPVTLASIPKRKRLPEAKLWAAFNEARPRLLGALLTDIAAALRTLPSVHLAELPRMADFSVWAVAAERGRQERPTFLRAYGEARDASHELAVESSPIGKPLMTFATARLADGPWTGSASELLECLAALVDEPTKRAKDWPKSARGLSGKLRELAPALRALGLTIEFDFRGTDRNRSRLMRLTREEDAEDRGDGPSTSSQPSDDPGPPEGDGIDPADGRRAPADGSTAHADGRTDGPTSEADGTDGRAPRSSDAGRDARTWRCTGCRALQFAPTATAEVRCAGCGSTTDAGGRVICLDCHRPAEDGQRRRCIGCVRKAGGAA
jgi:hypothetical protein